MYINSLEEMEKIISQKNHYITRKLSVFFPNSLVLEDNLSLDESFFLETGKYLSTNVQYFSMNQLIKYSLFKTNFPQSYFGQCKSNNLKLFDFPGSGINFDFKPQLVDEKTNLFLNFVSPDKPAYFFKKSNSNLYNSLLGAKIASSSFFLFEWFEFSNTMPYLSENIFFSSWQKWEAWKNSLNINCTLQESSFENTFNNLYKKETVKIDFVPIHHSCFYPMAIGWSEDIRSLVLYKEKLQIQHKEPFKRTIELDLINQFYEDNFQFYMQEVLKLHVSKAKTILLQNYIEKLKNNQFSTSFLTSLTNLITFKDNKTFYKEKRCFFFWKNITGVKTKARKENLTSFFAISVEKETIEEIWIRKLNKKFLLVY